MPRGLLGLDEIWQKPSENENDDSSQLEKLFDIF
jgi:hypothetical protein